MPDLPETVDLQWLARTLLSLQSDVRSLRDDMPVIAAVLNRLDSNQSALISEFRAVRSQHDRLRNRVEVLEQTANITVRSSSPAAVPRSRAGGLLAGSAALPSD